MDIYPNPGNGNFTFELYGSTAKDIHLEVFDLQGNRVHNEWFRNNEAAVIAPLQLHHLPGGIYMARVYEDGTPSVMRLVKQ